DAAHQNGNESFPLFAAAVLAATTSGLDAGTIDTWTKAYLFLR
ncbi:MAG: MAPEG family protein, partial [Terriglobus roseus]|nr:MAPEG family protein [Terriglobus roseus]